jgi:hypothetical protein
MPQRASFGPAMQGRRSFSHFHRFDPCGHTGARGLSFLQPKRPER